MLKVNADNEYKAVERVYSGSTEIDKILDKNGNVLFAVNKEVEGTPALTYTGKEETNLKNYRIYGNTVNGESVGDRTGNLFDGTFIHRSVIRADVSDNDPNRRSIVVDISNFNNGDKITFSRETSAGNTFQMYQVSSPLKGGRLFNDNVFSGDSETLLATITLDDISNYPYLMIFLNGALKPIVDETLLASKIMVNVGDTSLPYEPYGYKVPVKVEGKNLYEITKFYDDSVSKTVSGITFTISNNKVIYSGTATDAYPQTLSPELPLIPGQSYYAKIIVKGSYGGRVYIFFRGSRVEGGTKQNYKQITSNTEEVFTAWYNVSVLYVAQGNGMHSDASVEVVITKVPSVTTPIYLPEQIKMVGDEAEYIDYAEQKQHFADGTSTDVLLPALPTLSGTNTLSVGTEVQPSNVYFKGRIKEVSV